MNPATIRIDNNGKDCFLTGDVLKFRREDFNNVYKGNIKDFLESFNDKEKETGLCRVDDYNMTDMKAINSRIMTFIF